MLLVNGLKFAQVKHPFQILDFVYFATSPILYITNEETGPRLTFAKTSGTVTRDGENKLKQHDGDGNENGKKAIGLDWQNNNFARASHFFSHFFAVAARLQRASAEFHICRGREDKATTFFFFS